MKKKPTRKSRLPTATATPIPAPPPATKNSPKSLCKSKEKAKTSTTATRRRALFGSSPSPPPPPPSRESLPSISDLKDFASSRLRDLKRNLIDCSHTEILNDLEASRSRIHKRFKIQTQACQQAMDESDKDFKKMSDRINGSFEATKESYEEFMADAQATASRVCKTTLPELSKSFEKAIRVLQSRFGIHSA